MVCAKCGEEKSREQFYCKPRLIGGLSRKCKTCANKDSARWFRENPEKAKQYSQNWHLANPEKAKVKYRKYRAAHPERVRAASKRWHELNRDKILQVKRDKNRKRYTQKRGYVLADAAKSRAKMDGLPFDLDRAWVQAKIDGGICELTGAPFDLTLKSWGAPSLDQIVAGGGYTKDNVRIVRKMVNTQMSKWGKEGLLKTADDIRSFDFVKDFHAAHDSLIPNSR